MVGRWKTPVYNRAFSYPAVKAERFAVVAGAAEKTTTTIVINAQVECLHYYTR